jgi:Tat protein translocase TatB subunit
MGFFGIGTGELVLILVIALIIWGPAKLPEIAQTLGRTVRALRKATFDLTSEVTKEIEKEKNNLLTQPGEESSDKTEESDTDKRQHHSQEMTAQEPGEAPKNEQR